MGMDTRANGLYAQHAGFGNFYHSATTSEVGMIERMYMRRLRELCMNRFTWKGLPETIDPRFVEKTLYESGLAIYCKPDLDMFNGEIDMILRGAPATQLDYQDNPLAYTVYANNFISGMLDKDECVPIWANMSRTPDLDIVMWYARRLAEAERTVDINLKNMRHPKVFAVSEEQRLTAVNFQRKLDEGEHVLFVTDAHDPTIMAVHDVGMNPDVVGKVQVSKNMIMGDCMTMLGVNNANQDKKERLVESETSANDDQVALNRAIALGERKKAALKINKMFGTNITVEWNEDVLNFAQQNEEGGENGDVHDGASEGNGGAA